MKEINYVESNENVDAQEQNTEVQKDSKFVAFVKKHGKKIAAVAIIGATAVISYAAGKKAGSQLCLPMDVIDQDAIDVTDFSEDSIDQ